jgi:2'-5' RNA ligase
MCGIVSFLDKFHDELVDELWRDMIADCTVTNKHLPPLPHFSWQVFEGCDTDQTNLVLKEIATNTIPFTVRTSGLGVFTGEQLVIYISLIKDEKLLKFQKMIWERTVTSHQKISSFYHPDSWMPHITLINGTNEDKDIICALDKLIKTNFVWEFTVDSIALIGISNDDIENGKYFHKFN